MLYHEEMRRAKKEEKVIPEKERGIITRSKKYVFMARTFSGTEEPFFSSGEFPSHQQGLFRVLS